MIIDAVVYDFTAVEHGTDESITIRLADGRLLEVCSDGHVGLYDHMERLAVSIDLDEHSELAAA